jgi:hypothetical protein
MRAAILLNSFAGPSDQAIAQAQRVNRNTVRDSASQKCLRFGVQGNQAWGRRPIYPRTV